MKKWRVFPLALVLVLMVGLEGSHLVPAQAQAGFSNASLSGTYVFHWAGTHGSQLNLGLVTGLVNGVPVISNVSIPVTVPDNGIGEIQADGAGNITSGSAFGFSQFLTQSGGQPPVFTVLDNPCNSTITGTYSINPNGSGTITLASSGSCGNDTLMANLRITGRGNEGVFITVKPNPGTFSEVVSGNFAKK